MEQMAEFAPKVQILDVPVLQMVEQLADILKLMDTQAPVEQVVDVPKIILDLVSQRSSLRECPPSPRVPTRQPRSRRSSWHWPGMLLVARGSTSVDHVGPIGGCRARATSSGAHQRDHRQPRAVYKYCAPWRLLTSWWSRKTSSTSPCRVIFHEPFILAVSCFTPCLLEEQIRGFFLVMASTYSAPIGWTVDTCYVSLQRLREFILMQSLRRVLVVGGSLSSLSVAVLPDFAWLATCRTSSGRRSSMPRSSSSLRQVYCGLT